MGELKSYSCPKCGGFLDVDRDRDTFDCPFCGASFNVLDFHREELIDEARKQAYDGRKAQALEKYEYLLSKNPDDFNLLYEYACAVDGIDALKKLKIDTNNPKNDHKQLRGLLRNDQKFMQGTWSDYVTKLYEVVAFSNKYHELVAQREEINAKAKRIANTCESKGATWTGAVIFGILGFISAFSITSRNNKYYPSSDIRTMWPMLVYFVLLAGIIIATVFANKKKQQKYEEEKARRDSEYKAVKDQSDSFYRNEVEPAYKKYKQALSELDALKPSEADIAAAKTRTVSKKPAKPAPAIKNPVCIKCGADLTLDNENKLYVCSHCGVSYDYENFVGSSVSKGRKELMSGEFELAEKWFSQTLEEDPGDFEANRGMILCAGKWRDFPDIRLNEKLKFAEWPKIEERLKAAKENSNYNNLEYFEEFQKMLEPVKTYHELAGKEDQESLFERLTAQKSFKLRYKVFAGMDRKYRTTYMNKPLLALSEKEKRENLRTALGCGDFVAADREYVQLLMNHPNDAEALRARVLCAGRWKTIDEISLDQKMSDGLLNQISGRIKIAKDNSSWDYYMYYELFGDVEEILRENFKALQQKESYEAKRKIFEDQFQEVMFRLSEKDKELFDFEKE